MAGIFTDFFDPIRNKAEEVTAPGGTVATANPPEDDCSEGFCTVPASFEGTTASPSAPDGSAANPDVVQPSSMEALLQDVLTEAETEAEDLVKELLRQRLNEIRRIEDLLNKAKADLAMLMQRDPKEIAASVDCPPGFVRLNGGWGATTGAKTLRAARDGGDARRNNRLNLDL